MRFSRAVADLVRNLRHLGQQETLLRVDGASPKAQRLFHHVPGAPGRVLGPAF
jgi:hypothetical protein